MAVPLVLLASAACVIVYAPEGDAGRWVSAAAWVVVALAGLATGTLIAMMRMPRLAYSQGDLLVYLRSWQPDRVPIEAVECFFRGQGSSDIPVPSAIDPQTSTIVVRLAEAAVDYHHVEVKPAMGQWCGGYIVLRGTWCEPITAELMQRLNRRLVEVHRERRGQRASVADGQPIATTPATCSGVGGLCDSAKSPISALGGCVGEALSQVCNQAAAARTLDNATGNATQSADDARGNS